MKLIVGEEQLRLLHRPSCDVRGALQLDAIAVEIDTPTWQLRFVQQWPPGSDAHLPHWQRITHGPVGEPADAFIISKD